LDFARAHVHHKLRAGGLGDSRAGRLKATQAHRRPACRILIRHLDLPNAHLLELRRDFGCRLVFGPDRAHCRATGTQIGNIRRFTWDEHADEDGEMQQRSSFLASTVLGIMAVFGVFNRITFPAFVLIPGLRLVPYYWKK